MKILMVHNRYQWPGGEDEVFRREQELLRDKGHPVVEYVRDNDEIRRYSSWQTATLPLRTLWAWDSAHQLRALLEKERPEIAHFHNTFPLISPAAYQACRAARTAVVQTLHNPRLLCAAATFFRNRSLCVDCLGKSIPWPAVMHGCYRDSRLQTATVVALQGIHRALETWRKQVDVFVASTDFYRRLFVEGGLPEEKVAVKPHFVPDPGPRECNGEYGLFVGRLAPEKGIPTLLEACAKLKKVPVKIRGDGPLSARVREIAESHGGMFEMLPRMSAEQLSNVIKRARFLIWPSEGYYETFGLVAVEAFACGVPVIASRIGVAREMVEDRQTGLSFEPGVPRDLAEKVEWAWTHPKEMAAMGRNARSVYEAKYTAERNYDALRQIYDTAIDRAREAA